MLKKSFSLASAVSLGGAVVWITATAACGGDEENVTNPTPDAGNTETSTNTSSSSSSSSGAVGTENPKLAKDPSTVEGATIPFTKCAKFEKCGGEIVGNYEVSGGCLADDTFNGFKQFCNGVTVHDVIIKARGTVGVTADRVARDTSIFVHAEVDIVKDDCFAFTAAKTCDAVGALLTGAAPGGGPSFDDAKCIDDGTRCLCAAQTTVAEKTDDPYTSAKDGALKTTGSKARDYEYCPKGTTVPYREVTKDNPTFSMVIDLAKK